MDVLETVSTTETQVAELSGFLKAWDYAYKNELQKIDLFNSTLTQKWSMTQKHQFAKVFYHIRGHFHDFLWYLGSHAPNAKEKNLILENIAEEFGGNSVSHEQLYFIFAESIGANLNNERTKEDNYLSFAREFNKGQLEWLMANNWESQLAAFSAYERLDNIDYSALLRLVISIGTPECGQTFFIVHNNANHFEYLSPELIKIWTQSPEVVNKAFNFIYDHQLKMWKLFSSCIFS